MCQGINGVIVGNLGLPGRYPTAVERMAGVLVSGGFADAIAASPDFPEAWYGQAHYWGN